MDTLFLNIDGVLNNSLWFKGKTKNEKCLASEKKYKCIMEAYVHSGFEEISVSALLIGEKLYIDNCKALPDLLDSIGNSRIFHIMNTVHGYPIDTDICYIHDYDLGISNERISLKDIKENDVIVSEFMYKELEGLNNMIYTAEKIYIGGNEDV